MAREKFYDITFRSKAKRMIQQANEIIAEYSSRGYVLTLRQLYYQFVSRDYIPNEFRFYKQLGQVINDARLAGEIDWRMIEDRTRGLVSPTSWEGPEEMVKAVADQFRYDIWQDQAYRVEVWIEKGALSNVVGRICGELRVPYFAARGYNSQSDQWRAGHRLRRYVREERQRVLILHLGDHDPSGIDMTRDNEDRLDLFTRKLISRDSIEFRRIALNMDQVEQYNPPPNPAKIADVRYTSYVDQYGEDSWELDALEPEVIEELVRSHVEPLIDWDAWNAVQQREAQAQALFNKVAAQWGSVADMVYRPDYE